MATPQDKNPVGRPLRYKTKEALEAVIEEYFSWCDNRIQQVYSPKTESVIEIISPAPYTMSGLARRIGLSRQALSEYSNREEFGDTIIAARERVHEDIENRLMEKNATGAIFNLKNNFGWKDKTEVDQNVSGELKTGSYDPELSKRFADFLKSDTLDKS